MTSLSEVYDEILAIRRMVNILKEELDKLKQKRNLRLGECLPSPSVCKDLYLIHSIGRLTKTYDEVIGFLANYYGCRKMGFYIDPRKCAAKYNAVYYPNEYNAYTYKPNVELNTVLHEWFHHMCNCGVVALNGKESKDDEKYAVDYALKVIERGEHKE